MTRLKRPELATLVLSAAALDPAAFSHRAPLLLPASWKPGGYAVVVLDAGAYRHAGGSLASLRVLSEAEGEVRYAWRTPPAAPVLLNPRMLNRVSTPEGGLQFVLDFGGGRRLHNMLKLDWAEKDFRTSIRLESSEDQSSWSLVREAQLLDFRQDGLIYQTREIAYPESSQRYLRVTIAPWSDPKKLLLAESMQAPAERKRYTEIASVAVRYVAAAPGDAKGDDVFEFSAPFQMPAPSILGLKIEGKDFVRGVSLLAKPGNRPWTTVCQETVARAGESEQVTIECPAALEGDLRLAVHNRDNPPIELKGVRFLALERRLVVKPSGEGKLWLLAGNASAAAPDYDTSAVLARSPGIQFAEASLGAWEENPAYQPPSPPLSERVRGALVPILALAVLLIAAAAALLLRQSS